MSAVGSNDPACSAARNDAGCSSRRGVRRERIEHAVLVGLKDRLSAPDLVEAFSWAVIAEINSQRRDRERAQAVTRQELEAVNRKLAGHYDAIADGLRTPGLKRQLEALEAQQQGLEQKVQAVPVSMPQLHPNLARLYREKVADLSAALSDPETRGEAAEILRELIERIDVQADDNGHVVQLTGDIVRLISLPEGQSVPDAFKSSVKLVAGARNHLNLQLGDLLQSNL